MKKRDKKTDNYDLQIIIASGLRDIEKVTVGLATALSCVYSGSKVVVFLTMEGASFANPQEGKIAYINGFESIQTYFNMLLEVKVRLEACASCVQNYCSTQKKNGRKQIRKGMFYVGLSTAAIRALKTPTVVF